MHAEFSIRQSLDLLASPCSQNLPRRWLRTARWERVYILISETFGSAFQNTIQVNLQASLMSSEWLALDTSLSRLTSLNSTLLHLSV